MIELIDLSVWKNQKDILKELKEVYDIKTSSREWRNQVEKWNKRFATGEVDIYITHSNKYGYKATKIYEEAKIGRDDYLKRALDMLKKVRECDRAFRDRKNLKYDFMEEKIK